jgi:hypothetical protein
MLRSRSPAPRHEATGLRCSLGLDRQANWRAQLDKHGGWLSGLVADKNLLRGLDGVESELVAAAHAAEPARGRLTFRDDQLGRGHADIREELMLRSRPASTECSATSPAARGRWWIV